MPACHVLPPDPEPAHHRPGGAPRDLGLVATPDTSPAPRSCTGAACPRGASAPASARQRATDEIHALLAQLRGRHDALRTSTVHTLRHTGEKLQEVNSTTECAASSILDALGRAGTMVDDLEAAERADDKPRAQATRDLLRDEIFGTIGALQFQDITSQQLAYAASLLADVEARLAQIAALFDPAAPTTHAAAPDPRTFDPRATTRDAEQRQALVDEVFAAAVNPARAHASQ